MCILGFRVSNGDARLNFKLTSKAIGWKAALSAIYSMTTDEATFEIRDEGLFFKSRDPSKVSMCSFLWIKERFTQFDYDFEGQVSNAIGFRVSDWLAVFKRFEKESDVSLDYSGQGKVKITSNNKQFEVGLIDSSYLNATGDEGKVPDKLNIDYDVKFEITMKQLASLVDDLKVTGVQAIIDNNAEQLTFSGAGDTNKARVVHATGVPGIATGKYSIEYLTGIITTMSPFCDKMILEVKTKCPLSLKLEIPETGEMQFYVAPMIENER